MGSKEHDHAPKPPPGWGDIIVGAIAFYLFSELVAFALHKLGLDIPSREALLEIQLAGGFFILVWAVLGKAVFEPFINAAIEREERIVGDRQLAQERRREAEAIEQKVRESLREARLAGIERRDALVDAAKRRGQQILEEAEQENARELENASERLESLRAKAEADLDSESEKLAKLVASRALAGTESAGTIH